MKSLTYVRPKNKKNYPSSLKKKKKIKNKAKRKKKEMGKKKKRKKNTRKKNGISVGYTFRKRKSDKSGNVE